MSKTLPNRDDFLPISNWVFDLDNTLYPRHTELFSQIDKKMTAYVSELLSLPRDKARQVQKAYYRDHGTTLNGLIQKHGVNANDFLEKVHDIDYSWVDPDPSLGAAIHALPGRKFIFTNGSVRHAERTATALGILDHFDEIFDIVAADLTPKPAAKTYDRFLKKHAVDSGGAAMFEDLPRNLDVPKSLGMRTVLVVPHNFDEAMGEDWERIGANGDHIDYVTDDLAGFLRHYLENGQTAS